MTSSSTGDLEDSLFLLHEEPPSNLLKSENVNRIKPHSTPSSSYITSTTTLPNQRPLQPTYRTLSTQKLNSVLQTNEMDSFINQFERRLDEHRLFWQKEYDRKIQQMIDIKNREFNEIKLRYETKLKEYDENYQQLEIRSGQINEESKRLKIEIEHEKQQNKIEQASAEQHLKQKENEFERKIHEIKIVYENEKQDLKRQHSKMYQDLLDETNQRLRKMENDYKYQQSTNETTVNEMDKRLVDLRLNIEQLQQIKQKLTEEKSQLVKNNEQLQLQIQEFTNKQRHIDRDHADKIQAYENELKSVRLRCETNIDLLQKENDILKSKSSKTIDDLEKKLSTITDKSYDLQNLYEKKFHEQQNTFKQYENNYENKINSLKKELNELDQKYHLSIQHNEQLQKQLKQQTERYQVDLEKQIDDIRNKTRDNEQKLSEKIKHEYEQLNQQNEDRLRQKYNKELEEITSNYDQTIEQMKDDLRQINQLSIQAKFTHDSDKQQLINEYEQFIRKLEKEYLQKTNEYERRTETVVTKTHEQLKSMEDEFEARHNKQQSIINDQQKVIETLKDEQNKGKDYYEKQLHMLSEQSSQEKNEIKAQFDLCMKNLEKNFKVLTLKKEELEHKLSYLNEEHKRQLIECRLSYETNLKDLLDNDVRLDLENTIHSLKQQVVYLQQRIGFLQNELEQYIIVYGHRPKSQT